ncbi:hypothetical protein NQU17_04840 [Clostridiaceae bacterium HFYG-1003]|nr:hypothetical protein NQU17_04840 [Clostridiaceae bacterium HFYG-1003]
MSYGRNLTNSVFSGTPHILAKPGMGRTAVICIFCQIGIEAVIEVVTEVAREAAITKIRDSRTTIRPGRQGA